MAEPTVEVGIEQLIPVINRLQDVFNTLGSDPVDLPQIVVVGSQSSGKSSVLENVVGKDFLPRGSGIVTRRPLVLQLIYLPPEGKNEQEEWGEFLHKPNQIFTDFHKIRAEIENETNRVTGLNKGVSNVPINLKIYSPHVVNLTLVDLPGITKVPVGDQPGDIEQQIRDMIMSYISKKNSIILAVTAANTDLANSDALQLAKAVDPAGTRTLGVLTKLDIMDKGTNAMDMLTNKVIPLALGFVGIVNRSQEDIIQKVPISTAHKREEDFFKNHPLYRTISGRMGTRFLARQLNKILMNHIKETLPDLKVKVNTELLRWQSELQSYGDPLYGSSPGAVLLHVITAFCQKYKDSIEGKLTELDSHELYGGARINYIFNDIFGENLRHIDPLEGLSNNDIRTTIRNATGPRAALFIPESSFELLSKRQIIKLQEPALACVEHVFDELQRIVQQVESKDLQRFATLREKVIEVVNQLLQNFRGPTRKMVTSLIEMELAFINTNHPDFIGGEGAMGQYVEKLVDAKTAEKLEEINEERRRQEETTRAQTNPATKSAAPAPPTHRPPPKTPPANQSGFLQTFFSGTKQPAAANPSPSAPAHSAAARAKPNLPQGANMQSVSAAIESNKEEFETNVIKSLLVSYFDIVRKNIGDTVPKSIMHFLVRESILTIQNTLVQTLYKEELFAELLDENPQIASRRAECQRNVQVLQKAHDIINEVRDFYIIRN